MVANFIERRNKMSNCPVCKQPFNFWTGKRLFFTCTCSYCRSKFNYNSGRLIKKNEEGLKEYEDGIYKEEYIKEKARLQAQKEMEEK